MAKAFRPEAHYYVGRRLCTKKFNTYSELKRSIPHLIDLSDDNEISVYRHRRGEWGEWFEKWRLNYKRKPVINEEGWM